MSGRKSRTGQRVRALPAGRFDVQGAGSTAFADIAAILGSCVPQVVGWCEIDVAGESKPALVLSQAWPFLPFGTDPAAVKKQQRYVAVVPMIDCFMVVEIAKPQCEQLKGES